MGNTHNNAANILSTLSPEAAQTLESHFRQQVAQEIAGGIVKAPAPKKERAEKAEKPRRGRPTGKRDKGFSAFIRAYDAEHTKDGETPKANDVVAAAAEQGLDIKPFHVYNVRNQAKKAAAKALDSESETQRQEEINAKRAAGLEKARAARAAKAAEANEETAAKAADESEAEPEVTESPKKRVAKKK